MQLCFYDGHYTSRRAALLGAAALWCLHVPTGGMELRMPASIIFDNTLYESFGERLFIMNKLRPGFSPIG